MNQEKRINKQEILEALNDGRKIDETIIDKITNEEEFKAFLENDKLILGAEIKRLMQNVGWDPIIIRKTLQTKTSCIAAILKWADCSELYKTMPEVQTIPPEPEAPEVPVAKPVPNIPIIDTSKFNLETYKEMFEMRCNSEERPIKGAAVNQVRLVENLGISYQDRFLIRGIDGYFKDAIALTYCDNSTIVAMGYLELVNERWHVILPDEQINYKGFKNIERFRLNFFREDDITNFIKTSKPIDNFTGNISYVECTIKFQEINKTDSRVLCVDFGTSNTSVGTYGINLKTGELISNDQQPQLVQFLDVTNENKPESPLCPTIVYVDNCKDKNNIKYLFGYAAKRRLEEEEYITNASVFFEIKRWIAKPGEEVRISDGNGNVQHVLRKDIIAAYLLFIINSAERYFKNRFIKIHFSAPVKLKRQFHELVTGIFEERKLPYILISVNKTLDEAVAIVYNRVHNLYKKGEIKIGSDTNVFVLDCGGGTTDSANCNVKIEQTEYGPKFNLTTNFENGNNNFGGDNVTYRIMQILKIKIAERFGKLDKEDSDITKLISCNENEILNSVEKNKFNEVLFKFNDVYNKLELFLPTRFDYDSASYTFDDELKYAKRNFYYLWQLAEKIKIRFYEKNSVQVDLDQIKEDEALSINSDKPYSFYVENDGTLKSCEIDCSDILITINEIKRAICGDIYNVMTSILTTDNNDGDLAFDYKKFNYYRLSGQSCKIDLFREFLKEFVPGKILRRGFGETGARARQITRQLKLDCVEGSIAYRSDVANGDLSAEIFTEDPKIIHQICLDRENQQKDVWVIDKKIVKEIKHQCYPLSAIEAHFIVKELNNEEAKEQIIPYYLNENPETATKSIKLDTLKQDILENSFLKCEVVDNLLTNIKEQEVNNTDTKKNVKAVHIIFAVPAKDAFGFAIYHLQKVVADNAESSYYLYNVQYENFENELISFFDGKR